VSETNVHQRIFMLSAAREMASRETPDYDLVLLLIQKKPSTWPRKRRLVIAVWSMRCSRFRWHFRARALRAYGRGHSPWAPGPYVV